MGSIIGHMPTYVLWAYRMSVQESIKDAPFLLFYGRNTWLFQLTLSPSPPVDQEQVNLDDYKSEMLRNLSEAWKLARGNISNAQTKQK